MDNAMTDIETLVGEIGANASAAARVLAYCPAAQKTAALNAAADQIMAKEAEILSANVKDVNAARENGLSAAMIDRLLLDPARIKAMADGVRAVAAQDDPVGAVMDEWSRPTGLHIKRIRSPLGVVGVIYESRPNVTADAGALCLKSGNAVILRGGSESFNSTRAIHAAMVEGLKSAGLPEHAIQLMPTRDRAAVRTMLRMTEHIDVIVPRGGKGLVGLVQEEARVPVFAHLEGICHIYLDAAADAQKSIEVVLNAKTRRTGICGAAECLLIHRDRVDLGQGVIDALIEAGVEVRASDGLNGSKPASKDDFGCEFLDMVIAARIVDDIDMAIQHIQEFGSNHTDCIMSEDSAAVQHFIERVDSAIVMHNASTQFADGGEFGMGAEIGIATGKMHARGPIGATELTSFRYVVTGDGTTRA